MTLEDVILELYRLAESKKWNGKISDESVTAAIEGLEKIWEMQLADRRRAAMAQGSKRQPRIWC
jgi:hypothetical protein